MQRLGVIMATIVSVAAVQPAAAQIGQGATTNNGYPIGQGATSNRYPGGGNNGYPGGPGYGEGGRGQQEIVCESRKQKRAYCPANTRRGVVLLRERGSYKCRQGRNWGFDRDGIWVDDGCKAVFGVAYGRPGGNPGGGYPGGGYPGGGYPGGGAGQGRVIVCESRKQVPARCPVDVYNGARLVTDNGKCDARSWSWDRGGIWVRNSCKGSFRVF